MKIELNLSPEQFGLLKYALIVFGNEIESKYCYDLNKDEFYIDLITQVYNSNFTKDNKLFTISSLFNQTYMPWRKEL